MFIFKPNSFLTIFSHEFTVFRLNHNNKINDIVESHCVHISSNERVSITLEGDNRISNCFHVSGDGFEEDEQAECNVYKGVKVPKF